MTKNESVLGVMIPLLVAVTLCSRQEAKPQDEKIQTAEQTDGDNASEPKPKTPAWGGLTVYRLGEELPKASHVVVLMHGLGGNGQDLVPLARFFTVKESTCFIFPEAPNGLPRGGRAWVRQAADIQTSREKVLALLQYIKTENPKAEIVLGGFSQGAIMASTFLETDSQFVDALILLSPSGHLPAALTGEAKHKPLVFLSHGRSDKVLPFQGSDKLKKNLVELKFQVEWLPFEGGHTIPKEVVTRLNQFVTGVQGNEEKKDK